MATDANVSIKIEDDDVEVGSGKDPWLPSSRVTLFVDVMEEEVKTHGSRDTGVFQPKSWERMRKIMNDKNQKILRCGSIKNKFFLLRTLHTKFKQLCEQTGVGWCPEKGTVVAEPEIWEKLYKINNKAKHFRKKGFPHFAAMSRILGDSTATGIEAHPSVQSQSNSRMGELQFLGLQDDKENVPQPPLLSPNHHQDTEVNLIITDYNMPGMTGYELLRKIKESKSLSDIPVVIMSSENIPTRINRCLEEGAEEFFLKPVQMQDVNKLRPHLNRGKQG